MDGPCTKEALGCTGAASLHVLTKDGAEVQPIALEQVWVMFGDDGAPLVNAAELYESQGTILAGDFDFDRREDFAVQVDQNGPYAGPTFAVFLHAPREERFVLSEPLSQLTREKLDFFTIDAAKKRLRTQEKSGCCFHVTEEHEVLHGTPRVVSRITEEGTDDSLKVTEERLVRGRWVKKTHREPLPPELSTRSRSGSPRSRAS